MSNQSIAAAKQVIQNHIVALNARDEKALLQTMHFPHHRLSGTKLNTWETGAAYFRDFKSRAGGNWDHSTADDIQVVAHAPNKVHLDIQITRYAKGGEILSQFRSLWIFTNVDGHWAAAFRSSFAGD